MLNMYFQNKGAHYIYLAPTYSLVADIAYPLIEELLLNTGVPYSLNKSDGVLRVPGYGRIFFRTFTKPERIIGFSVHCAFLDEIDTVPASYMELVSDKITARIRQKIEGKKNQVFYISSPEGYSWFYNNFVNEPIADSVLIRMSTYSNAANLPDDYIDSMIAKYPASLVKAYIHGEFVNLNKLPVWADFDRKKNNSTVVPYEGERILVGVDFNLGRGCAVGYVRRDEEIHAIGEITATVDTNETVAEIKNKWPSHPITCYPDASGASRKSTNATESDIALLKKAGFLVRVKKKNPAIKDRVTATNAMFCNGKGERRLFVKTKACPVYTRMLETQPYDDKGLPVKDGKYDDITDAGTYPIAYLYPIKNNKAYEVDTEGL